ncbi:unnamed protein product [Phytophthora fragariaefolia]|uniref:Unnamed protein product n=1 Tax=Phytophthora fragariaefolia TaxID=1490495 RepID=A0A9W7CQE0_9STRA|nr:unnamed protein product [Phytophthora fragariaefolia]
MTKSSIITLEKPKPKLDKQKLTISTALQHEDTALITPGSAIRPHQLARATNVDGHLAPLHQRTRVSLHEKRAPSSAPQDVTVCTGSTTDIARMYGGRPGNNSSNSSSPSVDNHSDSSISS